MSFYSLLCMGILVFLLVLLATTGVINWAFRNCKTLNSFHGVKIVPDDDDLKRGYLTGDITETKPSSSASQTPSSRKAEIGTL